MMKEIKKHWFSIFIFCLIFLGTGGAAWIRFTSEKNGHVMELHENISSVVHTERSQGGYKAVCVVSKGEVEDNETIKINPLKLTDSYLLLQDYKYSESSVKVSSNYDVCNIEYYKAEMYDFDTLKLVNELDVKEIVDGLLIENPDYFIEAIYPDKMLNIIIALNKISDLPENSKRFYYSMAEAKLENAEFKQQFADPVSEEQIRMQEEYREEIYKLSSYITSGKRGGVSRISGLRTFQCSEIYNEPGVAYVTIACEELPVKSQELYSRFPRLKEYQGQKGRLVNMYFYGYQNPFDILFMFLEDGTNPWYKEWGGTHRAE